MKKNLIQATAVVMIFTSLATPAFAKDNDDRHEGRGRNFGQLMASFTKMKHQEKRELKKERKDEKQDEKQDDRGEEKKEERRDKKTETRTLATVQSACIKDAEIARSTTLRTAEDARLDAVAAAKSTFRKTNNTAWKVRVDAMSSARNAYLASAKDATAQTNFSTAKAKANSDWETAHKAAQATLNTAKVTSQSAWKTIKDKADADFKVAKARCTAMVVTDTTAPTVITNLALSNATQTSIQLSWTAPGDDGIVGTATSYDIRYATTAILSDTAFASATQVVSEPLPLLAGTAQSMTITGLTANTTYFFNIKAKDELSNTSLLSNTPSLNTLP